MVSRGSHGFVGILWLRKLQVKLGRRKEPEEFQQWMIFLELRVNRIDCKRSKQFCNVAAYSEGSAQEYFYTCVLQLCFVNQLAEDNYMWTDT